jgi:hypothetical protein
MNTRTAQDPATVCIVSVLVRQLLLLVCTETGYIQEAD